MNAFTRTLGVAGAEVAGAVRSLRAVLLVTLFVAVIGAVSSGMAAFVARSEVQMAETLQVRGARGDGAVTKGLWKSKPFRGLVRANVRDKEMFDDLVSREPLELLYAFLVFLLSPALAAMVSANRIADDIGSGAVRYMLLRVRRAEWALGKFVGQAALALPALAASGAVAHALVLRRLPAADIRFAAFMLWSFKAWFVALAWIGVSLGVSQLFRSGAKASLAVVLALAAGSIAPRLLAVWNGVGGWRGALAHLDWFFPSVHESALWFSSPLEWGLAAISLAAVGAFWLSVGHAFWARRNA